MFGYNTLGFGAFATRGTPTDANTVLLVRSDTTDGSNVFEDLSSYGHSVLSVKPDGSARGCLHSTDDKKMGASSIESTAAAHHLLVPAHSAFNFSTGNWTVEFWIKPAATSSNKWYFEMYNGRSSGFNNISMYHESSSTIRGNITSHGSNDNFTGMASGYDSTDAFHHYAMVRNGDDINVYADGVASEVTFDASSADFFASNPSVVIFGRNTQASVDAGLAAIGGQSMQGFMDEFKISNIARYTGNFTANGTFDYGLSD